MPDEARGTVRAAAQPAIGVQLPPNFDGRARSRLAVVASVYHQQAGGEQPTQVTTRFWRELSCDEQPYVRQLRLGQEWQHLDPGWVTQPGGYLVLSNEEGHFRSVNPTDAERDDAMSRVVEVATCDQKHPASDLVPDWLVRPKESMQGTPASLGRLWARCRRGTARVTLTILPG